MDNQAEQYPSFRWVVLALAWLAMVGVGWVLYLTPALAYNIVPDLGLTPTQLTLIFTAPLLMATFVNMPGGALGDRYGIRLVVGIAVVLAGLSTLARAWVSNFGEMFVLAGIFGLGLGMAVPNLPKLVAVWFPPKEAGLASGVYMTAFLVGIGVGLATGPNFGSWKTAFLCTGIILTVLSLIWFLFGRSAPKGAIKIEAPSIIDGIKVAVKSKNIWLLSLSFFLMNGVSLGLSGNLPEALVNVRNISPQEAGTITSLLTFAGIPGSILLPMISDKAGIRKPFVYVGAIGAAICYYFGWRLAPGLATYLLFIIGGFIASGMAPILLTFPMECKEFGQEYVASASGVAIAAANAGGFLIPLLVVTPLMAAQTPAAYNVGFLTVTLLLVAGAVVTIGLKETGSRVSAANKVKLARANNGMG
jgi:NNP family nitrate/nitrite transporter-like MFS transporter